MLDRILDGARLTEEEAAGWVRRLAAGAVAPPVASAVLAALRLRGETAEEIRGFARAMRQLAVRPALPAGPPPLVDTCGTGGDGSGSLNLSTATALLAAASGLRVAKHGNRSISSRCGSADVVEALGIPLVVEADRVGPFLEETGFAFLFAPRFHPAMREVVHVRREMGVRTVFNLLGPLVNPASPEAQLVGACSEPAARRMAEALAGLPVRRAFVVHGAGGMDEATPVGPFLLLDVRDGRVAESVRDPAELGLSRCTVDDLRGGDAAHNAARLEAVLAGEERGPHRDAVLLQTALVLEVAGVARDAREGLEAARAALEAGRGLAVLRRLRELGERLRPSLPRVRAARA